MPHRGHRHAGAYTIAPARTIAKTRFVLISDTCGLRPRLPKGDVLCHARGLSTQGSISELRKTLDWIHEADFEVKIIIAGEHDITLDKTFFEQYGCNFRYQEPQDSEACIASMSSYSDIVYLDHSATKIQLRSPHGPQTTFKIFGSPYVPTHGKWAFGYDRRSATAERLWSDIPLDTDVVLTHTPAYNHRDASKQWDAAGCENLRKSLWQVRPRLAICGRIHEARGVERVRWKLDLPHAPFLEKETIQWIDFGAHTQRMSLVDTTERGGNPLLNDGASGPHPFGNNVDFSSGEPAAEATSLDSFEDDDDGPPSEVLTMLSASSDMTAQRRVLQWTRTTADVGSQVRQVFQPRDTLSRLHHRNAAALHGRSGRLETLVVNASMVAKNPGQGLARCQKPIVVDIDLPVGYDAV